MVSSHKWLCEHSSVLNFSVDCSVTRCHRGVHGEVLYRRMIMYSESSVN